MDSQPSCADGALVRLAELGALLNSEQDQQVVRERAIDAVRHLVDCEASSLIVRDPASGALTFDVATGAVGPAVRSVALQPGEGIAGWVVEHGTSYRSDDLANDPHHSKRIDQEVGFRSTSLLCVPVSVRGRILGALQAVNHKRGAFADGDLRLLELLAQHVATAMDNARLTAELRAALTQLKAQQEQLVQAEKLSAMGLLAAGVAHEIRSPLTAISGYSQLLRRYVKPDDPMANKYAIIEQSIKTINRIANGLLEFAKKDDGCWEYVLMNEVVEETLLLAEHTLSRFKKVKVERELAGDLPRVEADKRQLQQVFLNLIMNAAEAMRGGGTLTIRTTLDERREVPREEAIPRVCVSFQDKGCGIPANIRERIFEPFFTDGKKAGTGLGLSICKTIMKKHRGEITFESAEGLGSTFYVYVPVLAREERRAP